MRGGSPIWLIATDALASAVALSVIASVSPVDAQTASSPKPAPTLTASARETVDFWTVAAGGARRGSVILNKLQLSATARGDPVGDPDGALHLQVFRTDGSSLSARAGDIQTASNIEALAVTRLFEAWVEQRFGHRRGFAVRFGMMDLNADFDPLETSALFINSSHGIGPDISKSGRNGPSIFPVSALGVRGEWRVDDRLTLRTAAFDGVPGDPGHPRAFAALRLGRRDGALLIGQADYTFPGGAELELGHWHYTSRTAADTIGEPNTRDSGTYASLEGALSTHWSSWVRAGVAKSRAQPVSRYIGFGIIGTNLIPCRPDDQFGFAVAHAVISPSVRRAAALPATETSIEASYLARFGRSVALQPDVQWIRHPAGVAGSRNALVFGLRLVFAAGHADEASSSAAADPTVSPEGHTR